MTLIHLRGFELALGLTQPIESGIVNVEYVRGGAPLPPRVDGPAIIFPKPASVRLLEGEVDRVLALPPTGGLAAVKWLVYPTIGDASTAFVRYTEIPDQDEIDFGDLPIVDPNTYLPLDAPLPSVQELLADALMAMNSAIANAASTADDRAEVEAARATVLASEVAVLAARDETLPARDLTLAYRDAAADHEENARLYRLGASTHAANALASAEAAADSADDSDDYRDLSATAATTASAAANDAEAARAEARQILDDIAADRGVPNGLAVLDANGHLPSSMLPDTVLEYLGVWNPSTNTPALSDATGQPGDYYYVSGDGTRNLGSGNIAFATSDRVVHNGTVWQKWDTTDQVTSVAGRQGVVVLTKSDVGLPNVDNTSDANKPISTATRTALDDTVNGASVVGDNLVFTKVGGAQVTAGNVRGPQGAKGDQGDLTQSVVSSPGATFDLTVAVAYTRRITLTQSLTFTLSANPGSGVSFTHTLSLRQATSGGPFTVTFPPGIRWSGPAGTPAPTMPTQAGYELLVHLFWTGTAWRGVLAGVFEA